MLNNLEMTNRKKVCNILPSFSSFLCILWGEESKKSANQRQESPVVAMFLTDRDGMSNLYRGPSIDASYHVSDHLDKWFQLPTFQH